MGNGAAVEAQVRAELQERLDEWLAEAQQTAKVARIGYLSSSLASSPRLRDAFLQGLRDLGYVEGRNVVIEYREAEGKVERVPALAAELVALKVDVIFVGGSTRVTLAAMQATKTIPIVFTSSVMQKSSKESFAR